MIRDVTAGSLIIEGRSQPPERAGASRARVCVTSSPLAELLGLLVGAVNLRPSLGQLPPELVRLRLGVLSRYLGWVTVLLPTTARTATLSRSVDAGNGAMVDKSTNLTQVRDLAPLPGGPYCRS
jgi:hypothetical protein